MYLFDNLSDGLGVIDDAGLRGAIDQDDLERSVHLLELDSGTRDQTVSAQRRLWVHPHALQLRTRQTFTRKQFTMFRAYLLSSGRGQVEAVIVQTVRQVALLHDITLSIDDGKFATGEKVKQFDAFRFNK